MQAAPLFAAQAARDAAPLAVTTPTSTNRRPPSVDDTNAPGASSLPSGAAQGSSEGLAPCFSAHGADPTRGARAAALRALRRRRPPTTTTTWTAPSRRARRSSSTRARRCGRARARGARRSPSPSRRAGSAWSGSCSRGARRFLVADDAGNSPLHLAVAAPDCLEALLRADGDRSGRPRDANTKTAVAIYERAARARARAAADVRRRPAR